MHHCRTPDGDGWLPLDELLERSDVVSIHLPLTGATRGLIGADRSHGCGVALLVNTGRGGIVDEPALVALRDGRSPVRAWTCSPTSRSRPARR